MQLPKFSIRVCRYPTGRPGLMGWVRFLSRTTTKIYGCKYHPMIWGINWDWYGWPRWPRFCVTRPNK